MKSRLTKGLHQYRIEIITVILLFSFALAIRLIYQHESVVDNPIRADAGKYFSSSYNLKRFGVFSVEPPFETSRGRYDISLEVGTRKVVKKNLDVYSVKQDSGIERPPDEPIDLSPGYPLFLSLFWQENNERQGFDFPYGDVLTLQAIIGGLSVVLTFVMARLMLSLPWAVFAGVLTALSPHLIVMDSYLLTENLFTLVMMAGTLIMIFSWKSHKGLLTVVVGSLLILSAGMRIINILFLFFLAPVYLLDAHGRSSVSKSVWLRQLIFLMIGSMITVGSYHVFRHELASKHRFRFMEILQIGLSGERSSPFVEKQQRHTKPLSDKYASTVSRKNATISSGSSASEDGWILQFMSYAKRGFKRLGNTFVVWCWHNKYLDDIYIYPMIRKGFNENAFLGLIYHAMRYAHWPLYFLTLLCPIMMYRLWRGKTLPVKSRSLLIPVLGFIYFPLIITLLSHNEPRYAIPARPFSYILAMASLSWLIQRHLPSSRP